MDPLTLMAVAVIAILIGWLALHLPEPPRMIVIAILLIALVFVLFRLLGLV
jgi:hypothetical protein